MQEKLTKQDFWIRGELIVVEDVPAGGVSTMLRKSCECRSWKMDYKVNGKL
jgi:hypothetical protein